MKPERADIAIVGAGINKNGDVHGFADFLLGYPNLTITPGIRYEVNTPFDDETNQLGNFDRRYPGGRLVVQGAQGLALINPLWKAAVGNTPFVTNDTVGLPRTLRYTYFGNIQLKTGFLLETQDQ